jgi:DNA-binding MarR family transcriptional regulator
MIQSDTERGTGYLVKRVQQALRRSCDTALRPTGLSMAQYAVLRALADHPDASAAELARLCFVTRQSLQDVLGGLRSAGLIVSADAPARGRARALQLSPLGKRRLKVSQRRISHGARHLCGDAGETQPTAHRLRQKPRSPIELTCRRICGRHSQCTPLWWDAACARITSSLTSTPQPGSSETTR